MYIKNLWCSLNDPLQTNYDLGGGGVKKKLWKSVLIKIYKYKKYKYQKNKITSIEY